MPTFLISGVLGAAFGLVVVALWRKTEKPHWASDVLVERVSDNAAADLLLAEIADQQKKIAQAYQQFGNWAYHFAHSSKPSEDEITHTLDYFGIDSTTREDYLHTEIVP